MTAGPFDVVGALGLPAAAPVPEYTAQLIAAGGDDVPEYGSPEWEALADTDPRKPAAALKAAEAWRRYWELAEVARRLELELSAARQAEDEEYRVEQQAMRQRVSRPRPSNKVLQIRRGNLPAAVRALDQEERVERAMQNMPAGYPAVHQEGRFSQWPGTVDMMRRLQR